MANTGGRNLKQYCWKGQWATVCCMAAIKLVHELLLSGSSKGQATTVKTKDRNAMQKSQLYTPRASSRALLSACAQIMKG